MVSMANGGRTGLAYRSNLSASFPVLVGFLFFFFFWKVAHVLIMYACPVNAY